MNKKYNSLLFKRLSWLAIIYLSVFRFAISQENNTNYKLKTVVIDAGHGGKDPGSLGLLTDEKDVVLAIALKLGHYIEENFPDVKVIYTRKTDVFVPLYERAKIATDNKADLFISIHANGNTDTQATGTETLVLGLHRADENFEVAKRENSVILLEDDYSTKYEGFDPNSPESYIIFSLMQNLYFDQSINFAALVQDQLRERAQRKDRGVKQQGLLVLAQTSMPGVLIETGFITNPDEEKFLMSDHGQDYIASAIYRAFKEYKNIVESGKSFAYTAGADKQFKTNDSALNQEDSEVIALDTPASKPDPDNSLVFKPVPSIEFKVQVTVSAKSIPLNSHLFKDFTGVSEYHIGKYYKYAVGSGHSFEEIIPYSKKVKEKFPDAFIIAVKEGKIIPLDQAMKELQQ